jgi:carbon starvation protein
MLGTFLSTGLVVFAWASFIWAGSVSTIWPMFGTANQLLAAVALAVGTSAIINAGKKQYAWVALVPLAFVSVTTLTAGLLNITDNFLPLAANAHTAVQAWVNIVMTAVMMVCAVVVLVEAARRWYLVLRKNQYVVAGQRVDGTREGFSPPEYGCC